MPNNKHIMNQHIIRIAVLVAALAIGICLFACKRADNAHEKITIAIAATPQTGLVQITLARGYYREEGLEAVTLRHPDGKRALDDLLAGKADFATVAETPVMFAILKGKKIFVIATIQTSSLAYAIVARRDMGILTFEDLRGKRVGASLGSSTHFFLDAMLVTHGIARKDIKVVDLKANEIPDALAHGDIDAGSTFTPYINFTQRKLGSQVIIFRDKDFYRYNMVVVATQDFTRKNPEKVRKLLHALVRAEVFVRDNPEEARKMVAGFCGIEPDIVRDIWRDAKLDVTLDQSLVLALEDESLWAIKNGLTKAARVTNYLDYIYFDGLKSVKPEAVRILR